MSFIKLEDVQKIIEKYSYAVVIDLGMRKDINSLPSIDLQEIIREMIKDLNFIYGQASEGGELKRTGNAMIGILEEAEKRILSK